MPTLPNYGIDAPKVVRNNVVIGLLILAAGLVAYVILRRSNPDLAQSAALNCAISSLFPLGVAAIMLWSSQFGKFGIRDRLMASIPWRGDEQVLDIGCGRGLALIAAARHLTSGHAIGIDLWSLTDLSGNEATATQANAQAENVAEKITLETGDARRLPFPDARFDVIVSMTALHNIKQKTGRAQALAEAVRVLKPGGRLAIFDIFRAGEYRRWMAANGLEAIAASAPILLWMVPGRIVTARKPIR